MCFVHEQTTRNIDVSSPYSKTELARSMFIQASPVFSPTIQFVSTSQSCVRIATEFVSLLFFLVEMRPMFVFVFLFLFLLFFWFFVLSTWTDFYRAPLLIALSLSLSFFSRLLCMSLPVVMGALFNSRSLTYLAKNPVRLRQFFAFNRIKLSGSFT